MNKKKVDSILKGITAAGIAMGGVSSIQGADMVMAAINESAADSNSLVDAGSLRNVAKLLKESGSYTGALDLNYREFARIYEFVNNVGDRHNHNCYLVMVTMNTLPEQLADIEEIEKALDCMEQSIRSKIRKVDVCTRYSSMQYLIILFEPQENQIPNVMERIFMHYYELCDRENFKPQYEYIKMTEVK